MIAIGTGPKTDPTERHAPARGWPLPPEQRLVRDPFDCLDNAEFQPPSKSAVLSLATREARDRRRIETIIRKQVSD